MSEQEIPTIDLDVTSWIIVWLVLATIIALIIGSINIPLYGRLADHGVTAQATIVKLTPEMHGTVCYEYEVDGKKFEGQSQLSAPNPPMEQIDIGQRVIICYDPLNPSRAVLGDPKPMRTDETAFVVVAALVASAVILIVLSQKQREKHSKDS